MKNYWKLLATVALIIVFFAYIVFLTDPKEESQSTSADGYYEVEEGTPMNKAAKDLLFEKWNACVKKLMNNVNDHDNFWESFEKRSKQCEAYVKLDETMNLVSLKNLDEIKYALTPVQAQDEKEPTTLLTLGIGRDTRSEVTFKNMMNTNGYNITFFGADPIIEGNRDLYSEIGEFFPFAVGGDAGISTASVLIGKKYRRSNVIHVDINYFVEKILKVKTFDYIWFDAEGAEYDLLDIFYRDGRFDRSDIQFCQINIEFHLPREERREIFMKFIKRIIAEQRFGFFKAKLVGHLRLFLYNFENEYCTKTFFAE